MTDAQDHDHQSDVFFSPDEIRKTRQERLARQMALMLSGGQVTRYHTREMLRPQKVGEHTYNVLSLVMLLTNFHPSHNLVLHVLLHDVAEFVVGDIPSPTKRQLLRQGVGVAALEDDVLRKHNLKLPSLSKEEHRTMHMADLLDGLYHSGREVAMGNVTMRPVFDKFHEYVRNLEPTGVELDVLNAVLHTVMEGLISPQ